jgi:hypothetical protein
MLFSVGVAPGCSPHALAGQPHRDATRYRLSTKGMLKRDSWVKFALTIAVDLLLNRLVGKITQRKTEPH